MGRRQSWRAPVFLSPELSGLASAARVYYSELLKEESAMDVTRREFVRGAGVIGAGAFLAGVTGVRGQAAAGGAASTSANGDLAVALVGCGTQGRILAECIRQIPGVRFQAICDIWEYNRS